MNKANVDFTDIKCFLLNGETFDGVEETRFFLIFFFFTFRGFPFLDSAFQVHIIFPQKHFLLTSDQVMLNFRKTKMLIGKFRHN